MYSYRAFILLHLLILFSYVRESSSSCSDLHHFTVSSSTGVDNSTCVSRDPGVPCLTLEYLISNLQQQDCLNITILDHQTLSNTIIQLINYSDVTISGKEVNILCDGNSSFVLVQPERIHFRGLTFVNCSAECPKEFNNTVTYPLVDYAALCMYEGESISISDCVFRNSTGTGVIMHDVIGNNQVVNTNFTTNRGIYEQLQHVVHNLTSGGLVIKRQYTRGDTNFTISKCHFADNKNLACFMGDNGANTSLGGGLHVHVGAENTKTTVTVQQSQFSHNHAVQGGAVRVFQGPENSTIVVNVLHTMFELNNASDKGGGMIVEQNKTSPGVCQFSVVSSNFNNNTGSWGGAITLNGNRITMEANQSYWYGNSANKAGYAIVMNGTKVITAAIPDQHSEFDLEATFNDCYFLYNKGTYNALLRSIGAVQVKHCKAHFNSCHFLYNADTALHVRKNSYATFAGNTTFEHNGGITGAAIYVDSLSTISLREGVSLRFENNHAIVDGGAIYTEVVNADIFLPKDICVFESISAQLQSQNESYKVFFTNNTAGGENQSIFVGSSKGCVNSNGSILLFDGKIFTFAPEVKGQIASSPDKITLNCSSCKEKGSLEVMLGEYFYLVPTVTDIFHNTAYLFGYIQLVNYTSVKMLVPEDLKLVGPKVISMDDFTKDNVLYISGNNKSSVDYDDLFVEFIFNKPSSYHTDNRNISVRIIDCKVGYKYNEQKQICVCVDSDVLSCANHSSHACIRYGYWLGDYELTRGETYPCSGQNCKYADGHCPRNGPCSESLQDFCKLNSSDDLCWEGRGGILCSSCRENYSFTFSALSCVLSKTCTPANTALIILAVITYWILIIIFVLFIMNLRFSCGLGFMYGIVYYFSVVSVLTDKTITGPTLSAFINTCIAITTLSPRVFGEIALCFAQNWDLNIHHYMFHYVTPVFVVGTIIFIICLSRYCRCPKAISPAENSPIHAICALILLSYTSLTYTSFEILKTIKIKGEARVYVDPKIEYFGPEHLPYALVALLFEGFIALPICLLLIFAPCLMRLKKADRVRLRLKPILDDLQACYRPECRWFAGFYFLARQLVYLANGIPIDALPQDNMLLHLANSAVLVIHSTTQPYKFMWLNLLDTLLLVDIFFLSFFSLGWSSNFMHRAIPYFLIMPPALFLMGAILVIMFRRVLSIKSLRRRLQAFSICRKLGGEQGREEASPTHNSVVLDDEDAAHVLPQPPTHNSVVSPTHNQRDQDRDFFRDCGEREPLLSDTSSSERTSYSSSRPSGDSERGHPTITTTSLRVSALRSFPPVDSAKKHSTN